MNYTNRCLYKLTSGIIFIHDLCGERKREDTIQPLCLHGVVKCVVGVIIHERIDECRLSHASLTQNKIIQRFQWLECIKQLEKLCVPMFQPFCTVFGISALEAAVFVQGLATIAVQEGIVTTVRDRSTALGADQLVTRV